MTNDKEHITEVGKPFALLQVPENLMGDICEDPNIVGQLEAIIGVDVLIVSQDIRLNVGTSAREEAEKIHAEIERFLEIPTSSEGLTHDDIKAEVGRLEKKRQGLNKRLGELRLRLALDDCPYQVGDVLVDRRGKRAVIKSVHSSQRGFGPLYAMTGTYIKKDGSAGLRRCRFDSWDHWKK